MKVTIPTSVTGQKDALFVLEVEFPVAAEERVVQVETEGPLEALDLSGSQPGGTYRIPVGLERLHVPMRVLEEGPGEGRVVVRCDEGPEAPRSESFAVGLSEPPPAGLETASGGRRWVLPLIALALVGGGIWFATRDGGGGPRRVPDVSGLRAAEAREVLTAAGLEVVEREELVGLEDWVGEVFRQSPVKGAPWPEDGRIEIVIGQGSPTAPVPSVVGDLAASAEDALRAVGFQPVVVLVDVSDEMEVGRVLKQTPGRSEQHPRGETVTLEVGRGSGGAPSPAQMVEVPTLVGLAREEAALLLEQASLGFATTPREVPAGASQDGQVLAQQPAPGKRVPIGTTVTLTLARVSEAPTDPLGADPFATDPGSTDPAPTDPMVPVDPFAADPGARDPMAGDPGAGDPGAGDPGAVEPETPQPETPETPQPEAPQPETPQPETPQPEIPEPFEATEPHVPEAVADGNYRIPDMRGWDGAKAEELLKAAPTRFAVAAQEVPVDDPELVGRVLRHRPEAGREGPPGTIVFLTIGAPTPEALRVPSVVDMNAEAAASTVRNAGYVAEVESVPVNTMAQDGLVLSQEPAADAVLAEDGIVRLRVGHFEGDEGLDPSAGDPDPSGADPSDPWSEPAPLPEGGEGAAGRLVPDLVGLPGATARDELRVAGYRVRVETRETDYPPPGTVLSQDPPAGTAAAPGAEVVLEVARSPSSQRPLPLGASGPGEPTRADPGGDPASAIDAPTGPPGVVRTGPPPPGTGPLPPIPLPPRDAPRSATVPGLTGQPVGQAVNALLRSGLIPVIEVDRSPGQRAGYVAAQRPNAGSDLRPGDLVWMTVSLGPTGQDIRVDLPIVTTMEVSSAHRRLALTGIPVRIIELQVPGHPYAGTRRVAAQWPVSTIERSKVGAVYLWVITP